MDFADTIAIIDSKPFTSTIPGLRSINPTQEDMR